MSLEEKRIEELKSKYRLDRLEFERRSTLDLINNEVQDEGGRYGKYLSELKKKYGLGEAGLEFERGCASRGYKTLQSIVNERERKEAARFDCCLGATEFLDKPVRMTLLISKRK
jgi:hypothetical protein